MTTVTMILGCLAMIGAQPAAAEQPATVADTTLEVRLEQPAERTPPPSELDRWMPMSDPSCDEFFSIQIPVEQCGAPACSQACEAEDATLYVYFLSAKTGCQCWCCH